MLAIVSSLRRASRLFAALHFASRLCAARRSSLHFAYPSFPSLSSVSLAACLRGGELFDQFSALRGKYIPACSSACLHDHRARACMIKPCWHVLKCVDMHMHVSTHFKLGCSQGRAIRGSVIPRSPPWYQYWDPIGGLPSGAAV
eukprot:SAG31_NODE_6124_length_2158_cov_1.932977_3_plen_143_part_01